MRDTGRTPATVVVVVIDDGREIAVGRLEAPRADLTLVDAVLRLQLAARRRGWSMRVRGVPDELRALLEFAGLAGVLAFEPGREPELGEQRGVEEVVQPLDPPA